MQTRREFLGTVFGTLTVAATAVIAAPAAPVRATTKWALTRLKVQMHHQRYDGDLVCCYPDHVRS